MTSPMLDRVLREEGIKYDRITKSHTKSRWKSIVAAIMIPFAAYGIMEIISKPDIKNINDVQEPAGIESLLDKQFSDEGLRSLPYRKLIEDHQLPVQPLPKAIPQLLDLDLKIPMDVPNYIKESIEKEKDYAVADNELDRVGKYVSLIDYFSTKSYPEVNDNIDPNFTKAVVTVESKGDTQACSEKYHARGLSQMRYWRAKPYLAELMKSKFNFSEAAIEVRNLGFDATYISRKKLKRFRSMWLHDPALNILLTSYGLSKNRDKFGDRMDLIAAEWNAGLSSGITEDKHVADLPETKEYIGRVKVMYEHFTPAP